VTPTRSQVENWDTELVELLDISACSQVGVALFEARP